MIKNLIVGGCSFTKTYHDEWPLEVLRHFDINGVHINLAESGAGNTYIADSLMHSLRNSSLDPKETLVLIMWSGACRIDLTVSDEFFAMVQNPYKASVKGKNYIFSGGDLGEWHHDALVRPLFTPLYKAKDFVSLARDTITNISQVKEFLEYHNYPYRFMSYVNYWRDTPDFVSDMDLSITHYLPDMAAVADSPEWIWVNNNKDCFYEYAVTRNLLSRDGFHPSAAGHKKFTHDVIIPQIQGHFK